MSRYVFTYENDEESVQTTYSVHLPDGVTWSEVLRHFANFLESNSYVNVVTHLDDAGML